MGRGIDSRNRVWNWVAKLHRLAGRYDNPMPTWFIIAPIAGLKLPTTITPIHTPASNNYRTHNQPDNDNLGFFALVSTTSHTTILFGPDPHQKGILAFSVSVADPWHFGADPDPGTVPLTLIATKIIYIFYKFFCRYLFYIIFQR